MTRKILARWLSGRRRAPTPPPAIALPSPEAGPAGLQGERPISGVAEDRLDRGPFAGRVAETLATRSGADSVVVGIYGPWGDGKSSTLSMIKEALAEKPDVVVVDYNPWFFSSDPEAITRSFFLTIGEALEESGLFSKERVGELMATYGGLIPQVGEAVREAGKKLEITSLTSARKKVEATLRRHAKRVVVFIDDIDRLDRREIQTLFKLVRLSGDFPHTAYVMAFDDEVVAEALGEAYGGGDKTAGRRFLEKIVQAPLHLPPAKAETLRKMAFDNCTRILTEGGVRITATEGARFAHNFIVGFGVALQTPRQVRLYDNALTFAVPLMLGEVNVYDQMLIEGLRVFYPRVYAHVREHRAFYLKTADSAFAKAKPDLKAVLSEALAPEVLDTEALAGLAELVSHLFPRAHQNYGSDFDDGWNTAKRICAAGYFDRYFTYGVPTGDLADALVHQAVAAAAAGDAESVAAVWRQAAGRQAIGLLVEKLRRREDSLPEAAIEPIVRQVAAGVGDVPRTAEPLMGDHGFRQAAILIAHLAKRLGSAGVDLVTQLAATTPSLMFAEEIVRWSTRHDKEGSSRGFIDKAQADDITATVFARLQAEAAVSDPFTVLGDDFVRFAYGMIHGGQEGALRALVLSAVMADAGDAAAELLATITPTAWNLEDGTPHKSDFDGNVFKTLEALIDPQVVAARLSEKFGPLEGEQDYPRSDGDADEADLPRRLARQFIYVLDQRNEDEDLEEDEAEP